MVTRRLWECALVLVGLSLLSTAQQTPSVARDPQAVALVQAAINVMGGSGAAQGINTVVATGTTNTAFHSFVWKDDFSTGQHAFRREITDGTNTRLLLSNQGTPASAYNSKTRALRPHVAYAMWPLHVPIIVLSNILQNANYGLSLGPQVTVGSSVCNQILAKDASNPVTTSLSVQQWYLDATTGLPVRVQYRIADGLSVEGYAHGSIDYSDFRSVNSIAVPFQLATSQDGKSTAVVTITSIQFNAPVSASDFEISGVQQ